MKFNHPSNLVAIFFLVIITLQPIAYGGMPEKYKDYVKIRIYPDDSAVIDVRGSLDGDQLTLDESSSLEELSLNIEIKRNDVVTQTLSKLDIKLDPESLSTLTDVSLDLSGNGNSTNSDLILKTSYPGVCEVNGSINLSPITPPNKLRLEIGIKANIYYNYLPKNEASLLIQSVPLMKSQISAELNKLTEGNISLDRIEVQGYNEYGEYGQLDLIVSLSGDLRKAIEYMFTQAEIDLTSPFRYNSISSIGSYSFSLSFEGKSSTIEAKAEASLTGDFDEQINVIKNGTIQHLLDDEYLDEETKVLASDLLAIDIFAHDLKLDLNVTSSGNLFNSSFEVDGLGLQPGSLDKLVNCMKNVSNNSELNDYKIIMEGASISDQYVTVNTPVGVDESGGEEENTVIMSVDELSDLDELSYSVNSKQSQVPSSTLVAASAFVLIVVGVVAYLFLKKKV